MQPFVVLGVWDLSLISADTYQARRSIFQCDAAITVTVHVPCAFGCRCGQTLCRDALSAALLETLAFAGMEKQTSEGQTPAVEGASDGVGSDNPVPQVGRKDVEAVVAAAVANMNIMWGAARYGPVHLQ